jgi:pimeloyl-ACP methyl ester carboxylesterase
VEITTQVIGGPGGRPITVDSADVTGFPVLVHGGSPGSRRLFGPAVESAARHGLRLISYDRPGYGDTPPVPGRTVADAAAETRAIAGALGLTRIGVWGFSGGGMFALGCAAAAPDLVAAAAVLASFAPHGMPGLDWAGGWPDSARQEVELFFTDRAAAREKWRADAAEQYPDVSTPEGWLDRWGKAAGKDAAHSREVAEYLALLVQDGMRQGDQGWWDDWAAALTPWGCDVRETRVPVQLWHGENDRAVPVGHGRWLAANVPGIDAHITGDDHSTIDDTHRDETYAWLARHA